MISSARIQIVDQAELFNYGFRPIYNLLPEVLAKRFAYKLSITAVEARTPDRRRKVRRAAQESAGPIVGHTMVLCRVAPRRHWNFSHRQVFNRMAWSEGRGGMLV